jgi:glyoxylase-like metal-dependent hydrolase (beta-lactamase superfamily II)
VIRATLFAAMVLLSGPQAYAAEASAQVRLYALDCGSITAKQLGLFSDTGEYDGKTGELVDPCFVIRHPKGVLVWDTGLGDAIAAQKDGVTNGPFHIRVDVTLASQLEQLEIKPADVNFLAFSHFHFDHLGNALMFPNATWILNKAEHDAANASPPVFNLSEEFRQKMGAAKKELIAGDHDVFGDGAVRILKAPGHTPGHQVLALKLQKTGTVVLSGDLYHLRENRQFRRMPVFNYDRADTLASIDRIETIVKNTKARFVVQHDPADFKALPKFPAYLD